MKNIFLLSLSGFILGACGSTSVEEVDNNEPAETTETPAEESEVSEAATATLDKVNEFPAFIDSYKDLEGPEQSGLFDDHLYESNVTWTGTIFEITSQDLYLYGKDDFENETWQELSSEGNKAYNVIIAEFENSEDIADYEIGQEVVVEGTLGSRGNYDMNYNWKLYETTIVE